MGIALGSAGTVGTLAFVAPGLAVSAAPVSEPLVATATVEVGTTAAFTARGTSTDRNTARPTLSETAVAIAAEARADGLARQDHQVTETQTTAAAEARSAELKSTQSQIDEEVERIESTEFYWPTEGGIGSPWGMRKHPILGYTRMHGGSDIGGKTGAPIYAVQDGTVTRAAMGYNGGSGNNVRIDHGKYNGDNLESSYLHMNSLAVKPGQKVKKGQLIGTVGNTGLSTAPHLHFSIYINGTNSDPAPYLNA
ncbi:MAG: M23 family metallopeptidase [Propioniciclava sp.]